jgi:hypothetical protein
MKTFRALDCHSRFRHITRATDGRQKRFRVRIGAFDSSFSDLQTALYVRDVEVRNIFRA